VSDGFLLLGRDQELAHLRRRIHAAAAGTANGGLLLLEGEAGIGKSTLAARVMREAGVRDVAVGRCPGPGESLPFGPWLEIIAGLAAADASGAAAGDHPLTSGLPDTRQGLRQQAMALLKWLGRRDGACLVLLEDLQWADPATLDVLRQITPELGRTQVVVLATVRTDEVTRDHPLWTLLPQLQRGAAERLYLGRLSRDSVQPLLQSALADLGPGAPGLMADIYERSGGHPLFLFELLRTARLQGAEAVDRALPDSVLQVIDLKLRRLSAGTADLLALAAVIGGRFEYDLLAAVAVQPAVALADALQEALALRLIRPEGADGDHFAFDHALVREAILGRLLAPQRRRWHAAIADVLLRSPVPDVDRVALHLGMAGDGRGVDWLMAAGDRALSVGAKAQAKEHYARALDLLAAEDRRRGRLLLKHGFAGAYHNPAKACVQWRAAVEAAAAVNDPAAGVWARHLLLHEAFRQGQPGVLEQMAELEREQVALLADDGYLQMETELFGQPCGYPRIAGERAALLGLLGRHEEAEAILAALQAVALHGAPSADVTYARFPVALWAGDWDRACEVLRQVRQQRRDLKQYRLAAAMQFNRLYGLLYYRSERVEDIDEAAHQLLEDDQLARERAGEGITRGDFSPLGVYQFLRGDWVSARRNLLDYHRALPEEDHPLRRLSAAQLARALGAPEQALALLAPIRPIAPAEEPRSNHVNLTVLLTRVEALLDLGDLTTAAEWLATTQRWADLFQAHPWQGAVGLTRSRLRQLSGDLSGAHAAAGAGLHTVERYGYTTWRIEGYRRVAELLLALGGKDTARTHLRQGLALAEASRFPYEAALCHLGLGTVAQAMGDGTGVRAHLRTAEELLVGLGGGDGLPALRAARQRLADAVTAGMTPSAEAPRLTERERAIVRLVAEGGSDKEIGAQLHISHRTVDRHLRNIFIKLGVSNRSSLAAHAVRHGLLD